MTKLKRFIRPGPLISVAGHVGVLLLGLLYVGAHPAEAPSPEAMVVDIVPPNEAPRLQGTPADLMTSGSNVKFNGTNSAAESAPPPKSVVQPRKAPERAAQQRDASQATKPPQQPRADLTVAEIIKEEVEKAQQPPEENPDQPNSAETIARQALAGGAFGAGFNAPPVDTNKADYDFTAAFRERVSFCAPLPRGIDPGDSVNVSVRIFLNRDGTVASPPLAMEPITSEKQRILMQTFTSGLERCQPYTMLPADKYKYWKSMDVTIFPLSFAGQ